MDTFNFWNVKLLNRRKMSSALHITTIIITIHPSPRMHVCVCVCVYWHVCMFKCVHGIDLKISHKLASNTVYWVSVQWHRPQLEGSCQDLSVCLMWVQRVCPETKRMKEPFLLHLVFHYLGQGAKMHPWRLAHPFFQHRFSHLVTKNWCYPFIYLWSCPNS